MVLVRNCVTLDLRSSETSDYPHEECRARCPWVPYERAPPIAGAHLLSRIDVAVAFLVISVCVIMLFTERWLFSTWDALSPDGLLFHLQAPLTGTNSTMIVDYLLDYGLIETGILMILL